MLIYNKAHSMNSFKYRLLYLVLIIFSSGCCDEAAISKNIQNLTGASAKLKSESALSLSRCGAKAAKAVPLLAGLIYDQNVGVQSAAAYALRQIDTPQAREILKQAEARKKKRR